ncbi:hypothetical protein O3M35_004352 [Rhynocoris fuscipes]|uniref:BZIP domain-containing protein n=1 Tax=Rhynocoris fuscipes TaxID=488301 RepID=A0AAW1CME7_9HEMI
MPLPPAYYVIDGAGATSVELGNGTPPGSSTSTDHDTIQSSDEYCQNGAYDMNSMPRKDLFSHRKQREFIPDNKKDESYWDRRRRNNEAAKRSREKRRYNDMILEQRVVELSKENHFLKAQLDAIKDKYGISGEAIVNVEQVMATLPTNDQVLSITKRAKINNSLSPSIIYHANSVPIPTPVIHKANASTPLALNVYQEEQFSEERYPFPFPPVLPPLNPPVLEAATNTVLNNSVLNLSRRGNVVNSNVVSNVGVTTTVDMVSLPHKLRHKSHIGDKDVAATALLSLHHIKQEARASPPWDTEGSSDERDSGISLGAEWIMPASTVAEQPSTSPLPEPIEHDDNLDDSHLKSEVARLESEVASLKSMIARKKPL